MIRVLIIDDSKVACDLMTRILSRAPGITVVGTAGDAYEAREKIVALRPNVVTLDLELPRMHGLNFLQQLMKSFPLPVIVVSSGITRSSELALAALRLGAVDVIPKPGSEAAGGGGYERLIAAVRLAGPSVVSVVEPPTPKLRQSGQFSINLPATEPGEDRILALGASTGGTKALEVVLQRLPADCPPVVIVQHMSAGFTRAFAEHLDSICAVQVREASDRDTLSSGQVLIAPAGLHMTLSSGKFTRGVRVKDGAPIHFHRPSVDALFHSVAMSYGSHAVGALLTGMGRDGAEGLLAMRRQGAKTIAEAEETCVVYGMPKAAVELNAASEVVPLPRIAERLVALLEATPRGKGQRASLSPLANQRD